MFRRLRPLSWALLLLFVFSLWGCGAPASGQSDVQPPTGIVATVTNLAVPSVPPAVPATAPIFPANPFVCAQAYKNPAKLPHPQNRAECQPDGTLKLAEGETSTAELDMIAQGTVGLAQFTLSFTVDLTQAVTTYAGLLMGTNEACHCGTIVAMNAAGDWKMFDASQLDQTTIDQLTQFSGAGEAPESRLHIVVVKTATYLAIYSNGRYIVAGNKLTAGMFGFMAIAPSQQQAISKVVTVTDVKVWS